MQRSRLFSIVVWMSLVALAGSADASRVIELRAFERIYRFELPELTETTISQTAQLAPSFRDQFKTVGDLTPKHVSDFLNTHPENRDAILDYILRLPENLLRDATRLSLVQTIVAFEPKPSSKPPLTIALPRAFVTEPLTDADTIRQPLNGIEVPLNEPQANTENVIRIKTSDLTTEPGFDFRFYRGLLLEYHFDTPALLRFDVRRQRFELEWSLD